MSAVEGRKRRIGLLGAGVVGGGVIELLRARGSELGLELARVAVKDRTKVRPEIPSEVPVGTIDEVLADPSIDAVVELIGGLEPALSAVRTALEVEKDVVTANKLLVAEYGGELRRLANERGAALRFEASVAGCLPIIEIIEAGLIFDRVERLFGILNGTTNFILTRCQRDGSTYEDALAEARAAGFAEADPTLDVSGRDTAQKLAILVGLVTGRPCAPSSIAVSGIEHLVPADHLAAEEVGCRIKLIASFVRTGEGGRARVAPTLVPSSSALGLTTDEYNAVEVECAHIGWQLHLGKGAGRMPTASAVIHDLITLDAARERSRETESKGRRPALDLAASDAWTARWLIRVPEENPAWPVSRIGAAFAAHGVEIVEYRRSRRAGVGTIVLSAETTKGAIDRVARDIAKLQGAVKIPVVLAMEPDA
jgi:homoserine dehydrogenase